MSYYNLVREQVCDRCLAAPGEWCWSKDGKPTSYHRVRILAAEKARQLK